MAEGALSPSVNAIPWRQFRAFQSHPAAAGFSSRLSWCGFCALCVMSPCGGRKALRPASSVTRMDPEREGNPVELFFFSRGEAVSQIVTTRRKQ